MNVIAHRSNSKGADKLYENTYASVQYCLEKGWGIEIDIRRSKEGEFYISH